MTEITYRVPSQGERDAFWQGLRDYNARYVTNDFAHFQRVAVVDATVIGGVNATSYWGMMHIENIWVEEVRRQRGIGSALLRLTESEARRLSCCGIVLDTMSFQALGFYRRHGYEEFGSVGGYEHGARRHYLQKSLIL